MKKKKKYKKDTEVDIDRIIFNLSVKIEKKKDLLTFIEIRIQKKEKEIKKKENNGANTKRQKKEIRADKKAAHAVRYTIRKAGKTIEKIKKAHPTDKKTIVN